MSINDALWHDEQAIETCLEDNRWLDPFIAGLLFAGYVWLMEVFMPPLKSVLLLIALLLFVLSAVGVPSRVNLTAAGLACWVLTLLF